MKKTSRSSDRWLKFAVIVALSTFCVLAFAAAIVGNNNQMSAFERGQYYFNADDDPAGPYDLEKARQAYEEAIMASSTEHELAWYQLGRIDFIEGKFDAALSKFETQREYFGDTIPSVYYMIGLTYGFKARRTENPDDWQKGIDAFEYYITFEPYVPWPRVDLAWLYFSQARFNEMIPVLLGGLEHAPTNPWLLNMLGLALMNTGENAAALVQFELADVYASMITEAEWGKSYPGNSPSDWAEGLASFQDVIKKNIELAKTSNTQ